MRAGKTSDESRLGWLEHDHQVIEGLDHLGIEVVSINLYALLLPGITNVTDRVRYHGFYAWAVDQFAQRPARGRHAWREWVRRLEFALALACMAHERSLESDETAVVGAFAARRLLRDLSAEDAAVEWSSLVDLDPAGKVPPNAYFKNAEGGFGQYYKGAADELGIMVAAPGRSDPDRQLTNYAGVPLARALAGECDDLLDLAASRRASLAELAEIGAKASPSAIHPGSEEESLLRQIVLDGDTEISKGQAPPARRRRRHSLLLGLHYVKSCGNSSPVPRDSLTHEFRWACQAERLPDGRPWTLPTELEPVRRAWASYQRNDVLNYTLEVFHWACLQRLDDHPLGPEQLAQAIAADACAALPALDARPKSLALTGSVEQWISTCRRSTTSDEAEPWGPNSTWAWFDHMQAAVSAGSFTEAVGWAARFLARLVTDTGDLAGNPFDAFAGADQMLAAHDVHLGSWLKRTAGLGGFAIEKFLADLVLEWVLFRHMRVATRKLAHQGVSTFKFRPEHNRLVLVAEPPEPTLTTPRLRQAFRFLEDLHYIVDGAQGISVTPDGTRLLGTLR